MNTEQEADWGVFDYELEMLQTLKRIHEAEAEQYKHDVKNAIVESILLHTRILAELLLSIDQNRDDEITLGRLLPDFEPEEVDKLRERYGKANEPDRPRWVLNKRLAHATKKRALSYDYTDVMNTLGPALFAMIDVVQEERSKRGFSTSRTPVVHVTDTFVSLGTSSPPEIRTIKPRSEK